MNARLIFDRAHSAAWNMAVDEALLRSCPLPTLRFYTWSEPSLSLGYFQALEERHCHAASARCPVVRRSTGGGAIVHDRELTYSFSSPEPIIAANGKRWRAADLYGIFHKALIACLAECGAAARLATSERSAAHPVSGSSGSSGSSQSGSAAFLCFQRREPGDVLLGEHKVAGSAQRRRQASLLQHGSVLLQSSACAPELPGIFELSNLKFEADEISRRWAERLRRMLGLEFDFDQTGELYEDERRLAERIAEEIFTHPSWTMRR